MIASAWFRMSAIAERLGGMEPSGEGGAQQLIDERSRARCRRMPEVIGDQRRELGERGPVPEIGGIVANDLIAEAGGGTRAAKARGDEEHVSLVAETSREAVQPQCGAREIAACVTSGDREQRRVEADLVPHEFTGQGHAEEGPDGKSGDRVAPGQQIRGLVLQPDNRPDVGGDVPPCILSRRHGHRRGAP